MYKVKQIFVYSIESCYDADYIVDTFYNKNIATIKKIKIGKYYDEIRDEILHYAYIDILEWFPGMYLELVKKTKNKWYYNLELYIHHYKYLGWCIRCCDKNEFVNKKSIVFEKYYGHEYYNDFHNENKKITDGMYTVMTQEIARECCENLLDIEDRGSY